MTPACVATIANGRATRAVWTNELGGMTFEIMAEPAHIFVKWAPHPLVLDRERDRLTWARAYVRVPTVLDHGADDEGSWLVTEALPGESAVAERWKSDPGTAVAAIGAGLRAFHDALPVADCPFSWSIADRLANIRQRAMTPERWHHDHGHLDRESAIALLEAPPPIDRLVVCHGDTCAPNTLVGDDGHCTGHVDLGALGVADRWADLAIATWSTRWNYGNGWEPALLAAYGVAADDVRTAYYRLLWDLGP